MLVLVIGNHANPVRLEVAKALKDVGAHAGIEENQYQDMDFRRLNDSHLDWKNPTPAPFDVDVYDELYLEREDEHEVFVVSDPRMIFYIDDYLGLAKSHRGKSRILVVPSDSEAIARSLVRLHGLSLADARRIAETYEGKIEEWCESTRRRYLTIEELDEDDLRLHRR